VAALEHLPLEMINRGGYLEVAIKSMMIHK